MTIPLRVTEAANDSNVLRTLPHNYEAERALLGAILINNRAHERVAEFLAAAHFADPVNGRIFETLAAVIGQGRAANTITLKTALERDELIIAAGGIKYLASLAAGAVTVINAGDYGRLVYDLARRREVISLCQDAMDESYDGAIDTDVSATIESQISALADLLASKNGGSLVSIGTAVAAALKRHEIVDKGEITGLSTGLRSLDTCLGMLEDGDLTVIAGRPSMGKSALVLTILYHVARFFAAEAELTGKKPRQALFFSQEMTEGEGADRVIAARTCIAAPRRRRDPLSETEWVKLTDAAADLRELPILIEPTPRATLAKIRTTCRQLQRKGGVGLIAVDYLQIMGIERGRKVENRTQEVGYLATGLKDLAKELGCPVIALSQLSRAVEGREDKRPNLSDLRESGEIEQAADSVAFCYRDQYYLERGEPKRKPEETDERFFARMASWQDQINAAHGKAEIIVAKARHGVTGTAKLDFDGPRTWFEDPAQGSLSFSNTPDGRPEPPPIEG